MDNKEPDPLRELSRIFDARDAAGQKPAAGKLLSALHGAAAHFLATTSSLLLFVTGLATGIIAGSAVGFLFGHDVGAAEGGILGGIIATYPSIMGLTEPGRRSRRLSPLPMFIFACSAIATTMTVLGIMGSSFGCLWLVPTWPFAFLAFILPIPGPLSPFGVKLMGAGIGSITAFACSVTAFATRPTWLLAVLAMLAILGWCAIGYGVGAF